MGDGSAARTLVLTRNKKKSNRLIVIRSYQSEIYDIEPDFVELKRESTRIAQPAPTCGGFTRVLCFLLYSIVETC